MVRVIRTIAVCWSVVAVMATFGCGDVRTNGEFAAPGVQSTGGQVRVINRPRSVVPNELESPNLQVFAERTGYELPSDLGIEARAPGTYDSSSSLSEGTIAETTAVDVLYVHADTRDDSKTRIEGTLTFDRKIDGVIATGESMLAANEVMQVASLPTEYPESTKSNFGVNMKVDKFEIGSDRKSMSLNYEVYGQSDSMRLIFEQ